MDSIAAPVSRLIDEFVKLPGVGPKTAQRLAYFVLRQPEGEARRLAEAIVQVKERVVLCSVCFKLTEHTPSAICANPARDQAKICVVEEPLDITALERTNAYRGVYHVLHGALNPIEGINPDDIKMAELVERVRRDTIEEIIVATNPNQLGDATAAWIVHQLAPFHVRLTRLARGLPMGGDLEYADDVTLRRALEGRGDMQ